MCQASGDFFLPRLLGRSVDAVGIEDNGCDQPLSMRDLLCAGP